MHYIRPVLKYSEIIMVGWIKGFTTIDIRNPYFCLYEFWHIMYRSTKLFIEYTNTQNTDLYSNYYDTSVVSSTTCNVFSSAFMSLGILYISPKIASVFFKPSGGLIVIPLVFMYMIQVGYDLWQYYNIFSLGLINHYVDPQSFGLILGKLSNLSVNLLSVSYFFIEF